MSAATSPSLPNADLAALRTRHAASDAQLPPSQPYVDSARYARCVEVSRRVRWDIDRDVLRQRDFDFTKKFLPDGLSFVDRLPFLSGIERRLLSQIQGRSYANIFGLVERFIGAKMLKVSRDHWLGDQGALEALVRFTDEELKHQALFRRIETMIGAQMPAGYQFGPRPDDVASFVLGKSTWSVLALTCLIELFTQAHYRASIAPDSELSPLFKDVFLFHWKEESQHAILDELEWVRENAKVSPQARDAAVDDLIALVGAIDAILQAQSAADTRYFIALCNRPMTSADMDAVTNTVLAAYRFQYIASGVQIPRFGETLNAMISPAQALRIGAALAPIMA
ncbi:hypothetical protein AB4Z48_18610 [Cupriavidus sp. 2TAF22]|uniref:hypothetical protein n=1 Tax=unclassified Cupriavidus TaxID=2640874 RepID=UPI003F8FC3D5